MKKFGTRILIFNIPIILFFIVTISYYFFSKIKIDSAMNELSKYECLLMGDSQIQRLRGELISKNAKNIASAGEHYYFTYQKLNKILQNKDYKIDKIVLGVSIHNFAPVYNRLFSINFSEGKTSLKRYLYFISLFDGSNFLTDFKQLLIPEFISSVYSSPDWGGFYESINSNPSPEIIKRTFNMHFSIKSNEEMFSHSQRYYLNKIDSLCSANNIDLILVSTPYETRYKEKIDVQYFNFFSETLVDFNHRLHLNFTEDKIDSNLMSDANHLNKIGAKYYSEIIGKKMNARTHNTGYTQ